MTHPQTARGGLWVTAQMALLLLVLIAGFVWPGAPAVWQRWTGGGLLVVAGILGVAGAVALGPNLTPFPRPRPGGRLVQHGVYRWIRHPLYTAVLAGALGWSVIRGSLPAGLFTVGLAFLLAAKARHEEHWLRHHYPDYARYARRTWRFVPFVY